MAALWGETWDWLVRHGRHLLGRQVSIQISESGRNSLVHKKWALMAKSTSDKCRREGAMILLLRLPEKLLISVTYQRSSE